MSARTWSLPGWTALAAVALVARVAPALADTLRWAPFVLGLVLFALPHGAVDHHVPRRLGRPPGRGRLGPAGGPVFLAAYTAAVGAGLLAWALAPVATLLVFLVVAAVHWGSGDAWYARAVHGRPPFAGRLDAVLFVGARGALPVALPALAHPAELERGLRAILSAVGGGGAPALGAGPRAVGLGLVGAVVLAAAVAGARRAGPVRARALDAVELAGLVGFFLVTPAILAVGTYLIAWHAPRHIARLVASDPAQAALSPARAVVAHAGEAAPLTLVSLAGLAGLVALVWQVPAATDAVAGAALALIAALTFPHAAVVAWMDREQRVFAPVSPRASARSTARRAWRSGDRGARCGGCAPGPASHARAR